MSCGGFTIPGMTSCGCGGSGGSCSCGSKRQTPLNAPAVGAIPGYSPAGGGAQAYGGPVGGGSVPGMGQAVSAEPPALLHLPTFIPPGMLSAMPGGVAAGRKRGQSGSQSQPGVLVTGKACEKVITLFVIIVGNSDPSGRGKKLLERVQKLLSTMGPWDCCPVDKPSCTVKLAIEIVRFRTSGGTNPTPVEARFYSSEKGKLGREGLIGNRGKGNVFGLTRSNGSFSYIIIPAISEWAESRPIERGGLNGLPQEAIPGTDYPTAPAGEEVASYSVTVNDVKRNYRLVFAYDVLAIIIHEILHAMGAGHDDDEKDGQIIPNIMNSTWRLGKKGAFQITTKTACAIASKNGVCGKTELEDCCKKVGSDGKNGKPGLPATMGGFIVPGMLVSGAMGNVGIMGYRSQQWTGLFPQEGRGISALPLRDIHGS